MVLITSFSLSAQESEKLNQFNQITEQVELLKKTNLVLAFKKLSVFDEHLTNLTIDQQLLYYKLLAEIYLEQNQNNKANNTLNIGLNLAKQLASPSILISELLYLRGFSYESLGDISKATKDYKQGLEVAESLHDKVQIAAGLINLGAIAYLTDDYERSLILLNDAYNIAEQTDDDELKGSVNSELGILHGYIYQDKKSMDFYQQSYLHFKKAGMLLSAHNSLINIATHHNVKKNYQLAIDVLQTIIDESDKDSPSSIMFSAYSAMAWAHLKKEQPNAEAAYQYLLKAKPYLEATDEHNAQLQFYFDQAFVLHELARYGEALTSINSAEKILLNFEPLTFLEKYTYINLVNLRGKVYFEQKNFQKAYTAKTEVINLTKKVYESEDDSSIAKVRLKLESEQADLQNNILKNQQALHEVSLTEAKIANDEQRLYLIISALVTLAFAWLLVKLIQSQHKLKIATNIDPLTQISNRRSLMKSAQLAFNKARSKQTSLSVLMIDIDHFKAINDKWGHQVGDEVLKGVAEIGRVMMRKSDVFGRYGGEEFMVCLPNATITTAVEIAQRIRRCIEQYDWQLVDKLNVNVSVGVASLNVERLKYETKYNLSELISDADNQLYQAKSSGRNKVCAK